MFKSGSPGLPGTSGLRGPAGDSDVGTTGPVGFRGPTGSLGPKGVPGYPGTSGLQGDNMLLFSLYTCNLIISTQAVNLKKTKKFQDPKESLQCSGDG